jgi:hypothetical protein
MTNILDTVARQCGNFLPSRPEHYLAIQIAKRLSDTTAVRHYLVLSEHYPEHLLLAALHQCSQAGTLSGESFMRSFRELTQQSS